MASVIEVSSKDKAAKIQQIQLLNVNLMVQKPNTLNYTKGTTKRKLYKDTKDSILSAEMKEDLDRSV